MRTRTLGADLTVSAVGLGMHGGSVTPTEPPRRRARLSGRSGLPLIWVTPSSIPPRPTAAAADPHANEKLVGRALKEVRNQVQIVTKFGIRFDETSTAVEQAPDPRRPAGDHPRLGGGLAKAAGHRPHRPVLQPHRMDPKVEPEAVAQGDGRPDPGGQDHPLGHLRG